MPFTTASYAPLPMNDQLRYIDAWTATPAVSTTPLIGLATACVVGSHLLGPAIDRFVYVRVPEGVLLLDSLVHLVFVHSPWRFTTAHSLSRKRRMERPTSYRRTPICWQAISSRS